MNSKLERGGSRAAKVALLSVSLSALMAGSPALAQPMNWTGFYAGLYAGGVWGRGNNQADGNCTPPVFGDNGYYCHPTDAASFANLGAVTSAASGSTVSGRFTGGLQAGHNWQIGSFVYGAEADFGAFRFKGGRSTSGIYPANSPDSVRAGETFVVSNSFDSRWLFTARGRIGWTVSNWLMYATGGLAMSRVTVTSTFSDSHLFGTDPGGTGSVSESKLKTGWTIGGGAEVAITRNWSLRGEYLYVDLGSISVVNVIRGFDSAAGMGYSNALGVSTDLTAHVARLAANYRF